MPLCLINKLQSINLLKRSASMSSCYTQGQSPETKVREYFYFIDHQGMLFLDDARIKNFTSCFKDKKFLEFFFKRLNPNTTDRYPEFPFLSRCGRERNFIRCDDYPIVFTNVVGTENEHYLFCYNHTDLAVPFQPENIYMNPKNGRIYHPAPENGGGIGLVASKLAIEFSKFLEFDDETPSHFTWNEKKYELDSKWYNMNK